MGVEALIVQAVVVEMVPRVKRALKSFMLGEGEVRKSVS